MYTCPNCHAKGIRLLAKWWSFPAIPALCKKCAVPSCPPPRHTDGTLVLSIIGITLAGFAASAMHSAIPLALAVTASALAFIYQWHRQPLLVLTPEQIAQARTAETVGIVSTIALLFFQ